MNPIPDEPAPFGHEEPSRRRGRPARSQTGRSQDTPRPRAGTGRQVADEDDLEEGTPVSIKAPPARARITVVEQVYHHSAGGQPTQTTLSFARYLDNDEQPYIRNLILREQWEPIDPNWLKTYGTMILRNEEGKFRNTIPSPEERAETAAKVIEIGLNCGGITVWLCAIPPGESCRVPGPNPELMTGDAPRFCLRCRKGKAACTLSIYPT